MSRTQNTTVNSTKTRIVYDASSELGLIFLANQTKEIKSELSSLEERISSLEHASTFEDEMSLAEICDEISAYEEKRMQEEEAVRILKRKEREQQLVKIRYKRKMKEKKAKARDEAKKHFMDALSRRVLNAFNAFKAFWTPMRIYRSIFLIVSILASFAFFRQNSWAIHVIIILSGIVMVSPFYRRFRQNFMKKHYNSQNSIFLFKLAEDCVAIIVFCYLIFCIPELLSVALIG